MTSSFESFCEQNQVQCVNLSQHVCMLIKHAWRCTHIAFVNQTRKQYDVCCIHIKFNTLHSFKSVSNLNDELCVLSVLSAHFGEGDMMVID
jgi:hypothetical protein